MRGIPANREEARRAMDIKYRILSDPELTDDQARAERLVAELDNGLTVEWWVANLANQRAGERAQSPAVV
jgi:hypothetical protein